MATSDGKNKGGDTLEVSGDRVMVRPLPPGAATIRDLLETPAFRELSHRLSTTFLGTAIPLGGGIMRQLATYFQQHRTTLTWSTMVARDPYAIHEAVANLREFSVPDDGAGDLFWKDHSMMGRARPDVGDWQSDVGPIGSLLVRNVATLRKLGLPSRYLSRARREADLLSATATAHNRHRYRFPLPRFQRLEHLHVFPPPRGTVEPPPPVDSSAALAAVAPQISKLTGSLPDTRLGAFLGRTQQWPNLEQLVVTLGDHINNEVVWDPSADMTSPPRQLPALQEVELHLMDGATRVALSMPSLLALPQLSTLCLRLGSASLRETKTDQRLADHVPEHLRHLEVHWDGRAHRRGGGGGGGGPPPEPDWTRVFLPGRGAPRLVRLLLPAARLRGAHDWSRLFSASAFPRLLFVAVGSVASVAQLSLPSPHPTVGRLEVNGDMWLGRGGADLGQLLPRLEVLSVVALRLGEGRQLHLPALRVLAIGRGGLVMDADAARLPQLRVLFLPASRSGPATDEARLLVPAATPALAEVFYYDDGAHDLPRGRAGGWTDGAEKKEDPSSWLLIVDSDTAAALNAGPERARNVRVWRCDDAALPAVYSRAVIVYAESQLWHIDERLPPALLRMLNRAMSFPPPALSSPPPASPLPASPPPTRGRAQTITSDPAMVRLWSEAAPSRVYHLPTAALRNASAEVDRLFGIAVVKDTPPPRSMVVGREVPPAVVERLARYIQTVAGGDRSETESLGQGADSATLVLLLEVAFRLNMPALRERLLNELAERLPAERNLQGLLSVRIGDPYTPH